MNDKRKLVNKLHVQDVENQKTSKMLEKVCAALEEI